MSTSTSNSPKTQRLEARITEEQKALFQRAADLEGQSLTGFAVANLLQAAEEIIQRHDVIELSPQDSISFVEALLNPPEPNEKLQAAARRYQERFGE